MNTLERDAQILRAHNIMDYSLLFGVERNAHYRNVKGPSRATTTTNSEEDDDNHQRG
jgi:hypothetical protein